MSGYTVAHLDEIEEASDGRCPWRPVRQHFGITAFGASAWTGRNVGDRIINEHDEREREPGHLRADDVEDDANEELYLVHRGRARFELDDDHVDAPAGARSYSSRPASGGPRSPRSRARRSSQSAASPVRRTNPSAGRSGGRFTLSMSRARTRRLLPADAS